MPNVFLKIHTVIDLNCCIRKWSFLDPVSPHIILGIIKDFVLKTVLFLMLLTVKRKYS